MFGFATSRNSDCRSEVVNSLRGISAGYSFRNHEAQRLLQYFAAAAEIALHVAIF